MTKHLHSSGRISVFREWYDDVFMTSIPTLITRKALILMMLCFAGYGGEGGRRGEGRREREGVESGYSTQNR